MDLQEDNSHVELPPAPLRVVVPSAASIAADYIRTLILDGVLRQGQRVPYDEIAVKLDMSRQPVREAILELEGDGLVVTKPKRGTFVGPFNMHIVREHHAVYGLLEGYAARQVAVEHDANVRQVLRTLCERTVAATDSEERVACAQQFLITIDSAGSAGRLRALLRQMTRFVPPRYLADRVAGGQEFVAHSLEPILSAIEVGDPDAAAHAVEVLWREVGERLIAHLHETNVFSDNEDAPA